MGFASGSVSFRRFAVVGPAKAMPKMPDQDLLDKLAEHALKPGEYGGEEVEYGWSGGRHIFDGQFSFEHNVFSDALCVALRIDTNKVPGDVKKAFTIMEEEATAAANPSGFISKQQKKGVKDMSARRWKRRPRAGNIGEASCCRCCGTCRSGSFIARLRLRRWKS